MRRAAVAIMTRPIKAFVAGRRRHKRYSASEAWRLAEARISAASYREIARDH
jgi:hypothetical protein